MAAANPTPIAQDLRPTGRPPEAPPPSKDADHRSADKEPPWTEVQRKSRGKQTFLNSINGAKGARKSATNVVHGGTSYQSKKSQGQSSNPRSTPTSSFWTSTNMPLRSTSTYYKPMSTTPLQSTVQAQPKPQKSWREICTMGTASDDLSLQYIPPRVVEGKAVVEISSQAINDAITHWSDTLIGYVVGQRPYYNHLKNSLLHMWSPVGRIEIHARENGYFIFKFHDPIDCQKVTSEGPWMYDGRLLILKKWSPASTFDRDVLSSLPLWIRIPSLPLKIWSRQALSEICSAIGKPIQLDALTANHERLLYARAFVEISASKPPPSQVDIIIEGITHKLPIEYEWIPPHCDKCFSFGHVSANCHSIQTWVPKGSVSAPHSSSDTQTNETISDTLNPLQPIQDPMHASTSNNQGHMASDQNHKNPADVTFHAPGEQLSSETRSNVQHTPTPNIEQDVIASDQSSIPVNITNLDQVPMAPDQNPKANADIICNTTTGEHTFSDTGGNMISGQTHSVPKDIVDLPKGAPFSPRAHDKVSIGNGKPHDQVQYVSTTVEQIPGYTPLKAGGNRHSTVADTLINSESTSASHNPDQHVSSIATHIYGAPNTSTVADIQITQDHIAASTNHTNEDNLFCQPGKKNSIAVSIPSSATIQPHSALEDDSVLQVSIQEHSHISISDTSMANTLQAMANMGPLPRTQSATTTDNAPTAQSSDITTSKAESSHNNIVPVLKEHISAIDTGSCPRSNMDTTRDGTNASTSCQPAIQHEPTTTLQQPLDTTSLADNSDSDDITDNEDPTTHSALPFQVEEIHPVWSEAILQNMQLGKSLKKAVQIKGSGPPPQRARTRSQGKLNLQ